MTIRNHTEFISPSTAALLFGCYHPLHHHGGLHLAGQVQLQVAKVQSIVHVPSTLRYHRV